MAWTGAILFSSVALLLLHGSYCDFPTDFLGNYLTDEEYNNRTFCWTHVCMEDSGRLIYAADHDSNKTAPCDDFKTFAMGNFFEHRVLNERYPYSGFQADVQLQFWDREKRMMLEPIEQGDPKMFKFMKSFFRLCVNSSLVRDQGTRDVIAYMRRLGILQLSPENDAERLDLKNAMVSLNFMSTQLFFDQTLTYREHQSRQMLCFIVNPYFTVREIFELSGVLDSLKNLKIDASYKDRMAKDFVSYLQMKKTVQDKFASNSSVPVVLKIKDLYEKYPSKHLDWLQMFNEQSQSDFQQKLDDEILIHNPQLLEGLHKLFAGLEEPFIANVFAAPFLIRSIAFYETYSFTKEDILKSGLTRARQRFEQCLGFFYLYMRPALEAMKAVNFYDQSVQKSATELVELAVADAIENIGESETIDNQTRDSVINKLRSARVWVTFPDEILNVTKIEGLYEELEFGGSESVVELSIEMLRHDWRLQKKPQDNWIKTLHTIMSPEHPAYFVEENILNVPVIWTLRPYFYPNRSRFFNMATLYYATLHAIRDGLFEIFQDKFSLSFLNVEVMVDKSYVRWEANGGVDLQLPSFKLTNRQMLWLCIAHMHSAKYHRNVPSHIDKGARRYSDSLNEKFNEIPSFREAFQCDELAMIEDEISLQRVLKRFKAFVSDWIKDRDLAAGLSVT